MVAKNWRKYPDDDSEPFAVVPLDRDAIDAWKAEAVRLRCLGYSIRVIARAVGKCYSQVHRAVVPGSQEREKARQAEREKDKRSSDSEYAEKIRTYVRRYTQLKAPGRYKHV